MQKLKMAKRVAAAGFTLLELLVVLVILGLLAGLVGPKVIDALGGAKGKTAKLDIDGMGNSLEMYKLDVGRYPTSQEGLQALIAAPSGANNWNGPYLNKPAVPKDPWGYEYHYVAPGQHLPKSFDLSSLGADNREGGDGENQDKSNWGNETAK
ncbi:MAG: type II secretion system major pseudopilin GspG [Pseudomonadota bacterium]